MELYFNKDGWLKCDSASPSIIHQRTGRFNAGMHSLIASKFGNKLQGTLTHYDAMRSAQAAANAMAPKGVDRKPGGASTHFVIDRDGSIFQLASIHSRTWHAGFKRNAQSKVVEWAEHGGRMPLPNGHSTESPNQWFVGVDLSNWGWLTKKRDGFFYAHDGKTIVENVFFDDKGKPWEAYTEEAIQSYKDLIFALSWTLGIAPEMHLRHQDTSPTRKVDPGPALPFHQLIQEVYVDIVHALEHFSATEKLPLPWDEL